jgi:tripartite ATP-independent transporter DctP family solute receptor
MKNLKILSLIFCISLFAVTMGYAAAPKEEKVLRIGHLLPEDSSWHKGCLKAAEVVKEKTNGGLQIEVYSSGQLGTQKQMIESVAVGTLDITMASPSLLGDYYKPIKVLDYLYIYKNYDHIHKVIDGAIGDKLKNGLLENSSIRIMSAWYAGARHLTTTKVPVYTLDDMKGLKIRVPEFSTFMDGFKALGANPVPIAFGELYMALKQGVVDGEEQSVENFINMKFYEVQHYMILTRHWENASFQIINEDVWQSLSPEYQRILSDALEEGRAVNDKIRIDSMQSGLDFLKEQGMEIIEIDTEPFRESCKDIPVKALGEDIIPLLKEIELAGQ